MLEQTNNELEQKDEQGTPEPGPSTKPRPTLKKTKGFTNIKEVLNVDPKVTNATTVNNDQALRWVRTHNKKSAFSIFQKNDGDIPYETYIKYKSIGPKHIQEYLSIDSKRNISQIKTENKKSADISTQKIYIQIAKKKPGKKDKAPAFNYKKFSKHSGMIAVETYKVNSDTLKEREDKLSSKFKFAEKMVAAKLAYGFTTRNDKKERPAIDLVMNANNDISLGQIIGYSGEGMHYRFDKNFSKQKKMKNVKDSLSKLLILLKLVRAIYDLHNEGIVHFCLNLESVVLNISPKKLKEMDYINIQRDLRVQLRNFQNAAVIEEVDKDLKGILYSPEFTDPEIVKIKKIKKGQYQHFDYYSLGVMIGVLFDCIVENKNATQDNSELKFFVYEGYEENLEPVKDCFKKYNLTDEESHELAMKYFVLTHEDPSIRNDIDLSDLIKMLGKIILRLEGTLSLETKEKLRGKILLQVKEEKEKITKEANAKPDKATEETDIKISSLKP